MNCMMIDRLPPSSPETTLVTGLKNRNERAFEKLLDLHGGQMLAVARRLMHSEDEAQDAVQDALICVFRKADSFEETAKLSTWLHRVTVNACLMKLRSKRRRHEVEIDDLLPAFDESGRHARPVRAWNEGPAAEVETTELREKVRECINQLPAPYRTVLLLRDIEEMETQDVAALLHCTPNCVKTRLHRARQALRTLLEPLMLASAA